MTMPLPSRVRGTVLKLALLCAAWCASACNFLRGYAAGESADIQTYETLPNRGFYRLMFEDFQGLNTDTMQRSAVPYKLLAASTVQRARQSDPSLPLTEASFARIMERRFGFLLPDRIANWPDAQLPQPKFQRPLGIVAGVVSRSVPAVEMETMNTGCSTCHAGNLWDAEGNPTREAWIGLPSSSINLEAYAKNAFASLKWASEHPDDAIAAVREMFPAVSETELESLRKFYLPQLRPKIADLEVKVGGFTPYSNGGPALTNGAATLQFYLGLIEADRYRPEQVAFTSIPDFGGLRLRRSTLCDGVYAPPGWEHFGPLKTAGDEAHRDGMASMATLVTLGTLGVSDAIAVSNRREMREVTDFLFDHYRTPPFPRAVDRTLADAGRRIYEARCESCHGRFEPEGDRMKLVSFPNRRVLQASMGTDPVRWSLVTEPVMERFRDSALGDILHIQRAGGYVALPLTGIWASAPYLHNGSVPTLWHLLTPSERPAKFQVGGHRLDLERVGIAGEVGADGVYRYPAGYEPWSEPEVYDTSLPGRSNAGHDAQVEGLTDDEKRQLIEFMKLL